MGSFLRVHEHVLQLQELSRRTQAIAEVLEDLRRDEAIASDQISCLDAAQHQLQVSLACKIIYVIFGRDWICR